MLDVGQGSEYVSDKWPCYIKANRGIYIQNIRLCVQKVRSMCLWNSCSGNWSKLSGKCLCWILFSKNAGVQHVFIMFRSSRPDAFCKNLFLDISENSHQNTYATVSFLKQLQAESCNFIKKSFWHSCFPVNFVKFLRTPFIIEHLWWLLLFV